jgi:hypothetical protein
MFKLLELKTIIIAFCFKLYALLVRLENDYNSFKLFALSFTI